MFNGRYTFDSMSVAKDSFVFASEYAVFDWGIPTIPRGNIQVRQHAHAMHEHLSRTPCVMQMTSGCCSCFYLKERDVVFSSSNVRHQTHCAGGNSRGGIHDRHGAQL